MPTYNEINFAELYKDHLIHCNHYQLPPTKWDNKANTMAKNLVEKESTYRTALLNAIAIQADETVLDIGCGPGTLALPLAKNCKQVYALDYSQGMLNVLTQYQQKWQIENIQPILKSWNDDWQEVPQADVVIASRSTLMDDLDDMIEKLQQKARKRILLTAATQPHFLDGAIFQAIGRDDLGFPTYIYIINALYQKGIQASLNFIETESGQFHGESYADLLASVEFSLGKLTEQEQQGLAEFYQEKQRTQQPIHHGQPRWALISWRVK